MTLTKATIKRVSVGLAAALTMAIVCVGPAFAAEESTETTVVDETTAAVEVEESTETTVAAETEVEVEESTETTVAAETEEEVEESTETTVVEESAEPAGYDLDVELTAGATCVITVRNQFSVHPDTNVEVTVGDAVYVLEDVEEEADKVTTSDAIEIGDNETSVFVRFGPDGRSSLSVDNVSCEAPAPTAIVATPTFTG